MGVDVHRLWVSFRELTQRELILLNYLVKIVYRSHLEITSIVGTSSAFPKATTLFLPVGETLKPLALFIQLPTRRVPGNPHGPGPSV